MSSEEERDDDLQPAIDEQTEQNKLKKLRIKGNILETFVVFTQYFSDNTVPIFFLAVAFVIDLLGVPVPGVTFSPLALTLAAGAIKVTTITQAICVGALMYGGIRLYFTSSPTYRINFEGE